MGIDKTQSSITSDLGRRLKALRTGRGLSLRDVAAVAQVSPSLLGQIERGEASPSLLSLVAISDALGTTAGAILDGHSGKPDPNIVTRQADRRIVAADFCRREYMMNPHDPYAEFAEFIIPPSGYSRAKPAAHSGRDYGVVIQGSVTIEYGEEAHELAKGDYIAFDGNTPHRVVNNTKKTARMIWVVIHPERE